MSLAAVEKPHRFPTRANPKNRLSVLATLELAARLNREIGLPAHSTARASRSSFATTYSQAH